jgi:hypothetical protein
LCGQKLLVPHPPAAKTLLGQVVSESAAAHASAGKSIREKPISQPAVPTLHFRCPNCRQKIRARDDKAGTVSRCPRCRTPMLIAAASDSQPPTSPVVAEDKEALCQLSSTGLHFVDAGLPPEPPKRRWTVRKLVYLVLCVACVAASAFLILRLPAVSSTKAEQKPTEARPKFEDAARPEWPLAEGAQNSKETERKPPQAGKKPRKEEQEGARKPQFDPDDFERTVHWATSVQNELNKHASNAIRGRSVADGFEKEVQQHIGKKVHWRLAVDPITGFGLKGFVTLQSWYDEMALTLGEHSLRVGEDISQERAARLEPGGPVAVFAELVSVEIGESRGIGGLFRFAGHVTVKLKNVREASQESVNEEPTEKEQAKFDLNDIERTVKWAVAVRNELNRHESNAIRDRNVADGFQKEVQGHIGKKVRWRFTENLYGLTKDGFMVTQGSCSNGSQAILALGGSRTYIRTEKRIFQVKAEQLNLENPVVVVAEIQAIEIKPENYTDGMFPLGGGVTVRLKNVREASQAPQAPADPEEAKADGKLKFDLNNLERAAHHAAIMAAALDKQHDNAIRHKDELEKAERELQGCKGKKVRWRMTVEQITEDFVYLDRHYGECLEVLIKSGDRWINPRLCVGKEISRERAGNLKPHAPVTVTAKIAEIGIGGEIGRACVRLELENLQAE